METYSKTCKSCTLHLPITAFAPTKNGKHLAQCRQCIYRKYFRPSALRRLKKNGKSPKILLTKEERRERQRAYLKEYRRKKKALLPPKPPKPIKIKPQKTPKPKLTYSERRARLNEARRRYRKANREKKKEEQRKYLARKKNDPVWRIRKNLRKRLKEQLSKGTRIGPYVGMIGCTAQELRTHLEAQFKAGMTWENYGTVWHVDHIRPLCSFEVTDKSQRLAANNYRNLQPLFAEENLAKGDKWDDDR